MQTLGLMSTHPPRVLSHTMLRIYQYLTQSDLSLLNVHLKGRTRGGAATAGAVGEPQVVRNIGDESGGRRAVRPLPHSGNRGDGGETLSQPDTQVEVGVCGVVAIVNIIGSS